jgi:DNA helicase-2/ATP-dependent DNA helicase PcrA
LTKHGNGFHLAQRARLEKADAAWILQVHETRAEASTMESVVAARFGLPTITFEPVHGAQYLTAWNIRAIFEALSDKNFTRGQECLAVYGRLFEHPIYHRTKDYHRWTYFQIAAANLEPRLMKLPLADGVNKWAVVTGLESLPYRGEVFSLDVEKDHLYSADGIVVHNSIYGWRGALPYEMLEGIDYRFGSFTELQLPCNYRSVAVVVELANALVEGKRGGLSLQQVRTDHGAMEWLQFDSGGDEARGVLAAIRADKLDRRYAKWQDYAILYRTNATSERFENILIKNNIPYEIVGNWSFYARAEIKDVLAYLRLSMGWDEESADRVFNKPGRYLGAAWRAELERQGGWKAVEAGKSFHFSRGYMHQRFDEFVQAVLGIQRLNAQGANVLELVDYVLYTIGYKQWLQGEQPDAEDEVKGENLEMLREAVADARSLSSVIDMANRAQRQRQPRGSEDRGVQLLTVHRAKGLEWPVVFVVGCNQAVMPHVHGEPEEEHRIFYVAVTRARDRLVVTSNGMASQFRWFVDPEGVEGDLDEEPGYVRVNGCDEADEAAAGWDEDSWGEISEGPSERKSGEEDDSDGSADDRHGSARHLQ